MTDRKIVDWEAIEREYRSGQLSIREIADIHDVSHVAIIKRAKRDGWERNLAEAIRETVTTRLVTDGVTGKSARETIELAAERGVQVVREHRVLIGRGQRLLKALFGELEEGTKNRDEIEGAIEIETADDENGKRRAMMLRAVALPSRAGTLVSLSSVAKTLISLDRQAFNLGDGSSPSDDHPGAPVYTDADRAKALADFMAKTAKRKT